MPKNFTHKNVYKNDIGKANIMFVWTEFCLVKWTSVDDFIAEFHLFCNNNNNIIDRSIDWAIQIKNINKIMLIIIDFFSSDTDVFNTILLIPHRDDFYCLFCKVDLIDWH